MSAEVIGWTLVHFVWQGAAIAGISAIAMRFAAHASARYARACSGLAAMAAAPLLTAGWLVVGADLPNISIAVSPAPSISLAWLTRLWSVGVLLLSARLLVEHLRVARLRSRSIAAPPALQLTFNRLAEGMGLRADRVSLRLVAERVSPAAVGILRPMVLMPAGLLVSLAPAQLEAILAHELAHIRRWDATINLLQVILETCLFYHPGVWWLSHRTRHEREFCCDEAAVATCGDALTYARALTDLKALQSSRSPLADAPRLAHSAQGGSLMQRIKNIIGAPADPDRARWALPALLGACALGLVSAAVAGTPEDNVWIDESGVEVHMDGDTPAVFYNGEEIELNEDGEGELEWTEETPHGEHGVEIHEGKVRVMIAGDMDELDGDLDVQIEAVMERVGDQEISHEINTDSSGVAMIKMVRVEDGGEPQVVIEEVSLDNLDDLQGLIQDLVGDVMGAEVGVQVTEEVEVRIVNDDEE